MKCIPKGDVCYVTPEYIIYLEDGEMKCIPKGDVCYWLTADLPVPQETEIAANVEVVA